MPTPPPTVLFVVAELVDLLRRDANLALLAHRPFLSRPRSVSCRDSRINGILPILPSTIPFDASFDIAFRGLKVLQLKFTGVPGTEN